jgi:hypothetical protein
VSGDEILVLIVSAVVGAGTWVGWYLQPLRIARLGAPTPGRGLLLGVPLLAAGVLFLILRTASASDVRDDSRYLFMYLVFGLAWVGVASRASGLLGLSPRDDVFERGNRAAAVGLAGAVLGFTLAFAGGNIGNGPGWWVVAFSAGLATAALFVCWLALQVTSRVSELVTVDRDIAAGVRLAGFLVGLGVVFGRAAAGDWISAEATVRDFVAFSVPAAPIILVAAVFLERVTPGVNPRDSRLLLYGVGPAILYLAVAVQQLAWVGPLP